MAVREIVLSGYRSLCHAEVLAVRDACNKLKSLDLSGCRIYTSSEPCPMCLAAIYWAQISSIYYCVSEDETLGFGYADKNLSEELRKPKENRKLKLIHVPNGKALGIFEKNLYKTGIRQT
ncbi:MAG: nucleoside deaminase [Bacteroidales bacterium]|nr:nucleoside deaminase [Bacteroidales bacterium]